MERRIYDVAISFRWDPDDPNALALFEKLESQNIDVFYSERRPEELVGTDGEQSFGEIFRDRSRVVVVFVRPDWGETRFTRAEKNAIRQRADSEGYDFSIWVPMGKGTKPPPFLPPERIYHNWGAYGVDGLAASVEARLQDQGRKPRPPSAADEIRRLASQRDLAQRRQQWIDSTEAVEWFRQQTQEVQGIVDKVIGELMEVDPLLNMASAQWQRTGFGVGVRCTYFEAYFTRGGPNYLNSIRDRTLEWSRSRIRSIHGDRFADSKRSRHLTPDLDPNGEPAWRDSDGRYRSLESFVRGSLSDLAVTVAKLLATPER